LLRTGLSRTSRATGRAQLSLIGRGQFQGRSPKGALLGPKPVTRKPVSARDRGRRRAAGWIGGPDSLAGAWARSFNRRAPSSIHSNPGNRVDTSIPFGRSAASRLCVGTNCGSATTWAKASVSVCVVAPDAVISDDRGHGVGDLDGRRWCRRRGSRLVVGEPRTRRSARSRHH
jgi:hypothetical protein